MTKQTDLLTLTAILLTVTLGACSNPRETLGLNKQAPDEFAVVKRAPLSMPPDFHMRPPRPGAARPQETTPVSAAQQTVFGSNQKQDNQNKPTGAEEVFLQEAGATQADPAIRDVIDEEAANYDEKNKPVAERLLGATGLGDDTPPATVVDAEEETRRIRQNIEDGKPITEGETPSIEN